MSPFETYLQRLDDYEGESITPVIHQVWLSKDANSPIPAKELELSYEVEVHSPVTYAYMFWDNARVEELWNLPALRVYKPYFNKAQPHIIKCDMTRYAILYAYGGIYMDMDCIFTDMPVIADTSRDQIYYFEKEDRRFSSQITSSVFNGYLVSRRHNPFWLLVLDLICQKLAETEYTVKSIPEVYATSGPVLLAKTIVRLLELRPDLYSRLVPFSSRELPVKVYQPSMSSWKADLVKTQVQSTGSTWIYILLALLPILFILVLIMWFWTQNSLKREVTAKLQRLYPDKNYTYS